MRKNLSNLRHVHLRDTRQTKLELSILRVLQKVNHSTNSPVPRKTRLPAGWLGGWVLSPPTGKTKKIKENEATLRREEEERLRAQVFANEKGFLESTMFNPGKAKEEAREKEVARLSAEWDTSPDKVREIVDSTSGKEELDFQVRGTLTLISGRPRILQHGRGVYS